MKQRKALHSDNEKRCAETTETVTTVNPSHSHPQSGHKLWVVCPTAACEQRELNNLYRDFCRADSTLRVKSKDQDQSQEPDQDQNQTRGHSTMKESNTK